MSIQPLVFDGHRLMDYDLWANEQTLASLGSAPPDAAPQRALQIFEHILAAHRLFLARVKSDTRPVVVWPEPHLDAAARQLQHLRQQWREIFDRHGPDEEIEYVNSKGERWHSRIGDIAAHLVIHSAYHRGQIAMLLASAGQPPAYTDFIHAARTDAI